MKTRHDSDRYWRRSLDGGWEKPKTTHRYPLFRVLLIALVFTSFLFWFWHSVSTAAAADQPLFDHSNCQYPDRSTNPPGGCDNTDPCDPGNTKGGSGACLPPQTPPERPIPPLDEEKPVSHNIDTVIYYENQVDSGYIGGK